MKDAKVGSDGGVVNTAAMDFLRASMADWEIKLFGLTTYFFRTLINASLAEMIKNTI